MLHIYNTTTLKLYQKITNSYSKVKGKYIIHLKNGDLISVWTLISAAYAQHRYIVNQGIDIKYLTESENFHQNFVYYFDELEETYPFKEI